MTDKTRDAFESECRRYWGDRCPDMEFKDGKYDGGRPAIAWAFWQAATLSERERHSFYTTGVHGLVVPAAQSKSDAIRQGGDV